uniref:Uncharacterized protein n=1 Tax=Rhodosorus marinus TaxID=101924 RepID=A0A7S0BLV4_9RHOD|mmetsp:Transcript_21646/g.31428  ORF Transcript_21646/g.31428 Transcript_21646/m.31428 type:complete len:339 (+) Transcript_21646:112-1128(+)
MEEDGYVSGDEREEYGMELDCMLQGGGADGSGWESGDEEGVDGGEDDFEDGEEADVAKPESLEVGEAESVDLGVTGGDDGNEDFSESKELIVEEDSCNEQGFAQKTESDVVVALELSKEGDTEDSGEKAGEDDSKGPSLTFPLMQLAAVASSMAVSWFAKKLISERRKQLVAVFGEQMAFADSPAHLHEIVEDFRRREPFMTPISELFETFTDVFITERPIDITTIIELKEVKKLLNISDEELANVFLQHGKKSKSKDGLVRIRFLAERLIPMSKQVPLFPLKAQLATSEYVKSEDDLISRCRDSGVVHDLKLELVEDLLRCRGLSSANYFHRQESFQ